MKQISWVISVSYGVVFFVSAGCQIKARNQGNFARLSDSAPPTVELQEPSPLLRGGSKIVLAYRVADQTTSVADAALEFARDGSNFEKVQDLDAGSATIEWAVPAIDAAAAKLRIIAKDDSGNQGTAVSQVLVIDSTPPPAPAVALASSAVTRDPLARVSASNCDDTASLQINKATAPAPDDPGWVSCSTAVGALSYTVSSEGTHELHVWAKDSAGNVSRASGNLSVLLDTIAPAVALGAFTGGQAVAGGSTQNLSWTATDLGAGLAASPIRIEISSDAGGSWSPYAGPVASSASPVAWNVPAATNSSTYRVRVLATDLAGNVGIAASSGNLVVDSSPPVVSLNNPPALVRGGAAVLLGFSITEATGSLSELKLQYAADGTTFGSEIALTANPSLTSYSWAVPTANTATAKLRLIATDSVGQVAEATTSAFQVDSSAPTPAPVSLASAATANSANVSITATDCTDVSQVLVNEGAQPAAGDAGWQACTTGAGAINYVVSGDGAHTPKIWSKDAAGNVSATATTVAMTLDTVAPGAPSATLNSSTPTNSTAVTITMANCTDTSHILANEGAQPAAGDAGWQACSTGAGAITYAIAATEASHPVKVWAKDSAANVGSAATTLNVLYDQTAPTLTAAAMSINGGAGTSGSSVVQVSLAASDGASNVSHFCLKNAVAGVPGAPAAGDSCWVAVNAPVPGLTPALTLSLANFNYQLGFSPGLYSVYAWVKDAASNVSALSGGGAGTDGRDKKSITYNAGAPPTITDILATDTDSPTNPPTAAELGIPASDNVYIKWRLTDDAALPATPVSLYYTTDDATNTLIAANLTNGQNGGCTVNHAGTTADDNATGCYLWTGGAPASSYFKILIAATDSASMTTFAPSTALNTWPPINFLAGNTENGIGGSATAAVFFSGASVSSMPDPGSLAVTANGTIYFRDVQNGILKIDRATGVASRYIRTTGASTGDGGPATSATTNFPMRIALDYQDRLLILDNDRIRRIESNGTINTIIGGGASNADGVAPLDVQITPITFNGLSARTASFFAMPNGDIYFQSDIYSGIGYRIRRYGAAGGTVGSVTPTGTQDASAVGGFSLPSCFLRNLGVVFDPVSSAILHMSVDVTHDPTYAGCDNSSQAVSASLSPATAVATGPHLPSPHLSAYLHPRVQARTGELYAVSRNYGRISRYQVSTNTWSTVVGSGTIGTCADGTAALACNIEPMDAFITAQGTLYFVDRGRIRTIDENGNVLTIAGQGYAFGDGGSALSARFGEINSMDTWNDAGTDKVVILDRLEERFREFSIGGNITTIAGNGVDGVPNNGAPGVGSPLNLAASGKYWDYFALDASGNTYFNRSGAYVSKLLRSTGNWTDIVGGGVNNYYDAAADGTSNIILTGGYMPIILGSNSSQILVAKAYFSGTHVNAYLKLYDTTTNVQTHLGGVGGAAGTTFCTANGTVALSACKVPYTANEKYVRESYDAFSARWVVSQGASTKLYTMPPGGVMNTLVTLPRALKNFAYKHDAGNNIVYYCGDADGRLYKYDLGNTTETALSWPIPSISCAGKSLLYHGGRNSLIFIYTQNGLYGIAEYLSP